MKHGNERGRISRKINAKGSENQTERECNMINKNQGNARRKKSDKLREARAKPRRINIENYSKNKVNKTREKSEQRSE